MSNPFLAEIVMFGGNFNPRGWALCNGQLLAIASNSALFSLLGTTYGGDGRTTFGLPDLRGRIAMHPGTGPGLPAYRLGQRGGITSKTLTINEMPGHNHVATLRCHGDDGNLAGPKNTNLANASAGTPYTPAAVDANMQGGNVQVLNKGGSQNFSIQNPFLCVNFIIALQGTFPSRS